MSELSSHAIVIVQNQQGLHMRPADMLVKTAGRFACEIVLEKAGQRVDCKSILGILTLGATHGSELSIEASGPDADQAVSEIVSLFQRNFDEE